MDTRTVELLRLIKPLLSRLQNGKQRAGKAGDVIDPVDLLLHWHENLIDPFKCFYCARDLEGKDWHLDHGNSLSRGGSHRIENLVPACKRCNLRKNKKHWHEFMPADRRVEHTTRFDSQRARELTEDAGLVNLFQTAIRLAQL